MSTSSNDESLLVASLENLGLEESHSPDAASDLEDDIDMSLVSGSILTNSFFPSSGRADNTPSRLPVPEETSHIVSSHTTEIIDLTTEAPPESLEPHVCDARECAALKVLQTTEILENILVYLPTAQLLPLQATSKQWSSLIKDSPTLRLHRFVHPLWPKSAFEFELLPLKMPGLEIRRGGPVHLGHWVEVQMTPRAAKRILQESKERSLLSMAPSSDSPLVPLPSYANLMITQPPITNMQAFLLRRRAPFPSQAPRKLPGTPSEEPLLKSKLSCDAGITLGFLADVARSILISASSGESDSVDRQVLFRAIVSFCQTDIAPRKRSGTRMVTALG